MWRSLAARFVRVEEVRGSNPRTPTKKPFSYESGILLAGRQGLTHYQAFGNERYAFYCKSTGNQEEANYRFKEALSLFDNWGALHKVEHLRGAYTGDVPSSLEG